ncbi:MAG: outer membrane protein OmpA-like peptidoglycan-associated protein [Bacteriovoracaceae bacterium]|jgi:outer membrane protein OmpA-like peptidoglycan-associated protein
MLFFKKPTKVIQMTKTKILITFFIIFLCTNKTFAINLQKFHFSNSPTFATVEDGLLSDGLITTDYKYIVIGSYNYVRAPFIKIDGGNRKVDIIEWMHTFNFGGAYRISDNLQIGASTFATFERVIPTSGSEDVEVTKLGDTTLDLKYKFFEKNKMAVSLTPKLYLGTGDEEYFTSNKETGYYLGFALDKAFSWVQFTFNLGHKQNNGAEYLQVNHKNQLHFSIGLLTPFSDNLDITAEFYRDTPYHSSNKQIPSEANIGLRYKYSNDTALFSGVGVGSTEESNSTDMRLYAGIKFFPSNKVKNEKVLKEELSYGKLYRVDEIYFDTAKDTMTEVEELKLGRIFEHIKNDPYISKLVIEGYASRIGETKKNKKLSERRSLQVKKFLESKGMSINNIQIVAYGNEKSDKIDLNKSLDRKVMLRIYRSR